MPTCRAAAVSALLAGLCPPALAQWNPAQGAWGKSEPTDLRVMTWNVQDAICSTNHRRGVEGSDWDALARIVAALRPDVLILQEAGDNSGNGTGDRGDGQAELEETVRLFVQGGPGVAGFVRRFAPDGYDLPHVFVSSVTDGYNRNVILSRHPFADLNGDETAVYSNFMVLSDGFATTGTGGDRGFMWAEIDLPDGVYAGDVVVGNSHLKAGGSSWPERSEAARRIALFLHAYYNGAGTQTSDPENRVYSPPWAASVLSPQTPIVWGGDLNENFYGTPVRELQRYRFADGSGTPDGPDRDGTDAAVDSATHPISGGQGTFSGSKLDYLLWQDSIAGVRRQFVFATNTSGMTLAALPPEVRGMPGSPLQASLIASDHRPVVVDLILPLAEACPADWDSDGGVGVNDLLAFLGAFRGAAADVDGDGLTTVNDLLAFLGAFRAGC